MEGIGVITFACVQAGNYLGRGKEYVNKLFSAVKRHCHEHFRFVCLTDDAEGYVHGVETIALPADLEGWWGKLYLFKDGVFAQGERVVFLDLDTLIIGKLDSLCAYRGHFAVLQDFYWPHLIGPGVMAWEAGTLGFAWDEWDKAARPRHPQGDWWWLNVLREGKFAKEADKLQLVMPGIFLSYKVHCRDNSPAEGASVVCFHGQPRPHECAEPWVRAAWR